MIRALSSASTGLEAQQANIERISNDLCSLRPHVERLCVTVEVPFDGRLQPGSQRPRAVTWSTPDPATSH